MQTLVGVAEPADPSSWPLVMIVDSTPPQRAAWHEQCQLAGVRHHFVGVKAALDRLTKGFQVAGIIVDRDRGEDLYPFLVTLGQYKFSQKLVELRYSGRLAGTNLTPQGGLQVLLRDVAEQTGCSLKLDGDPDSIEPAEVLNWCAGR